MLLLLIISPGLGAQESGTEADFVDPGLVRSQGEQVFSFTGGLFFPLFSQDIDGPISSFQDHLSMGATGALEWGAYSNKNTQLGGQLSGMFAFTPNGRTLSMVPIVFKYTRVLNFYPVTVPLSLGAGFSFNRLEDLFQFTPILKPGVSAFWNFNPEWSLGLNTTYWWVPEIHFSDELSDQSRFGNFLEVSLSVLYHF